MKRDKKKEAETSAALAELSGLRDMMARARSEFHHLSDPSLVEASIFELNALNARYGYLLRQLKERNDQ